MGMADRNARVLPLSLLARTNLTLAVSALLIAGVAIAALNFYVIDPIAQRSAADEAALLVLSAQTWVELPPDARPYFELELAQNHDLIISALPAELPTATLEQPYLSLLQDELSERLGIPVTLLDLGPPRGAGGVQPETLVVRPRLGGLQNWGGARQQRLQRPVGACGDGYRGFA